MLYSSSPWPRVKFIGVKPKIERPPYWGFHALHRSLKGFRDWVLKDEAYLIPGEEALPALQVVEAIYSAARSHQRVKIERFKMHGLGSYNSRGLVDTANKIERHL